MQILEDTNVFDVDAEIYVITTNAVLKRNNELTMGAGAALEAKKRFRNIAYDAGRVVKSSIDLTGFYGFRMVRNDFGIFQVKRHFKESADLTLIKDSAKMLGDFASKFRGNIAMNYPGIGFGHLNEQAVHEAISLMLPDNVWICKFSVGKGECA